MSNNVENIFENSKINAGTSVYGIPLIFKELMKTNEFKQAYSDYDYELLENYTDDKIKNYPASKLFRDGKGLDGYFLCNATLKRIASKFKNNFDQNEILLTHLFLGCCTKTETFDLELFFEENKINKIDVAKKLYKEETSKEPNNDEVIDWICILDEENKEIHIVKKERVLVGENNEENFKKKARYLNSFCTNLTEKAKTYTKPFVGRDDVIERTMQILCKKEKSNPIHVGEPGVGKSAVTKGLAKLISDGNVPNELKNATLYELDLTGLVAGTQYRGMFEERIKGVLKELEMINNPILFIDEIHMLLGAGGSENGTSAANILKTYLTEDKIKFIGATTYNEYRNIVEKDSALQRRFQKIEIDEPSIDNAIEIINGVKEYYEKYHNVKYTDEAVKASVLLTNRFIHDRFLPDKAIDMLDEAGAYNTISMSKKSTIEKEDIERIVAKTCKIPEKSVELNELEKILNMRKELSNVVFGQDDAINQVVDNVLLEKSGLGDDNKPIGSFLFVGPSGVGKTELSQQIAKSLDMNFIRIDMSEYQNENSISKLIGADPGLVGYDDENQLTDKVLKNPYSVVLFDEIEKAYPSVFSLFLQILDYGTLTDSHGRTIDFRNCIVIMTSNAGVSDASKPKIGFGASSINTNAIEDAVSRLFSVEFRNRLTAIIQFNSISNEVAELIVRKELRTLSNKLSEQNITIDFTDNTIRKLVKNGFSFDFGAREIQRVIKKTITLLIANAIANKTLPKHVTCDVENNEFVLV